MFYEMVRWEGVCYLLLDSPGCCWMDGGWPWMVMDGYLRLQYCVNLGQTFII